MATTNLLNILQPYDSQAQKMAAVSEALAQMERAIADNYELDVSSSTSASTNSFVLDYDDSDDLSSREALRMVFLEITGTPTYDPVVIHPDQKHLFYLKNSTTRDCEIRAVSNSGEVIPAGTGNIIYCTGTDVVTLLASARRTYVSLDVQFWGRPLDGEIMGRMIYPYDINVLDDTSKIVGKVGTNPAASFDIELFEDGNKRGTINIDTSGVFTYTTYGAHQIFEAGNELIFYAPATADTDIENIRFSLGGEVTVI